MAAPPSLHLFPPLEGVERRKEDLDELIRKSMDMRPTRPFARDRYTPIAKRTTSRSRTRAPVAADKMEEPNLPAPIKIETQNLNQNLHRPAPQPQRQPLEFNPRFQKTDPLPVPPAADLASLRRSTSRPMKYNPRRTPSARGRNRSSATSSMRTSATISPATSMASSAFSNLSSMMDSPITEPSLYGDSGPYRPVVKPEEYQVAPPPPAQVSSRRRGMALANPVSYDNNEDASVPGPPTRQLSSRASHRSVAPPVCPSPPRRQASSRASHRPKTSFAGSSDNSRMASPAPTDSSGSPTINDRSSMSISSPDVMTKSPEDFYLQERPVQSLFPTYNPSVPLVQQPYYPQRPVAIQIPFEKVIKPEPSPQMKPEVSPVPRYEDIASMKDLESLWNAANDQVTAPITGSFNLKLFRAPPSDDRKPKKITFGPSEAEPFYSLNQAPAPADEEDALHEALIFRHHTSQDDLLPIAHMQLQAPPPANVTRSNRSSPLSVPNEPACHITTVTPILATLHALDHAAKSPQAHTLALVDPKAESPAAAKMAARAVQDATERESCTLTWMRTCARTGKYELHHPSLGIFSVQVDGDVKSAFAAPRGSRPRAATRISILNPFASLADAQHPAMLSPTAAAFHHRPSSTENTSVLACLDFNEETLHIDAGTIQSLGNLYLLDVCVSTLLAVSISESQRPLDPGLIFAAPPPSLALTKSKRDRRIFGASSSKYAVGTSTAAATSLVILPKRTTAARNRDAVGRRRFIDWSNASAVMGIEHLADSDDLPRITRGVLGVLGAGFKTALWVLEFGVRISARMVIGLTRLAVKE